MKAVREAFGESQKAFADRIDVKWRTWQQYEADNRAPGAQSLRSLADLGVNVNWVLTGRGEMMVSGQPATGGEAIPDELLAACIAGVEEHLAEARKTLPPAKKAELVIVLAHMVLEQERESGHDVKPRGEWIARFVRLAS